ncbi:MAG: hypothetical protein AAF734_09470 [Bacteroidota bacterium]
MSKEDLHCHRLLYAPHRQEVLALSSTRRLLRWGVEKEPRVVEEVAYNHFFDIRPMNEEYFLLLNQQSCCVEVVKWDNLQSVQQIAIPIPQYKQLEDALFVPNTTRLLAGGGWNPLYFIDLETAEIINAFDKEEIKHTGYVTYLSASFADGLLVHTNSDQFNTFELRQLDLTAQKLTYLNSFDGDVRHHRDVVKFIPQTQSFVHVWMDMYGMQRIQYYQYRETQLKRIWEVALPMILHQPSIYNEWRSGLYVDAHRTLVGAGQQLISIVNTEGILQGRIEKHWIVPAIIQDMTVDLADRTLLLATDQGILKWDTQQPSTQQQNVRLHLQPFF